MFIEDRNMNILNITNYKPKEFDKLFNTSSMHFHADYTDCVNTKKQIEGDEKIAKGVQGGNSTD